MFTRCICLLNWTQNVQIALIKAKRVVFFVSGHILMISELHDLNDFVLLSEAFSEDFV